MATHKPTVSAKAVAADKRVDSKQGIKEGSKRDIRDDKKGK